MDAVFSSFFGSTVGTHIRQSTPRSRRLRSTIKLGFFLGDGFWTCSRFLVMLGSTADTFCVSVRDHAGQGC